jgi:arylsulfatase A-like enzyme
MSVWPRFAAGDPARRPLAVLFAVAFAESALGALVNVGTLAWQSDVGRVCRLEPFAIATRALHSVGVDALAGLPAFMRMTWDLGSLREALEFVAPAVALYLLFGLALATILAPLVAFVSRRWPAGTPPAGSRFWGRFYPAAVAVLFAVPATQTLLHTLRGRPVWRPVSLSTTVASLVAWGCLILILRTPRGVARALGAVLVAGGVAVGLGGVLATAAAVGGSAHPLRSRAVPASGSPNVLLVSIDTLRADHVHCYGYGRETTPMIDTLAREGARFATVVAPTTWTLPSHLTMLTGLPPEGHGVVRSFMRLPSRTVTLAEVFRDAGYATAGFVSAPYLAAEYGFFRGFDTYDDWSAGGISHESSWKTTSSPVLLRLVDRWLSAWSNRKTRRPFFLFVHMFDVHSDYTPPPPFNTLFDPGYRGWVDGVGVIGDTRFGPGTKPRDLAHLVALYDGGIRFTDLYLGKILDRVRALGVLDDTIVVVTADHGEEFLEHGVLTHRTNLYDTTLLVPLVIRFPRRVPAGTVVPQQVRLMDVPATILGLAGVMPPPRFARVHLGDPRVCTDLSPLIGRHPRKRPALPAFADLEGRLAAIRTDRYKLIIPVRDPASAELYDLEADPGERTNVAARLPALTDELRHDLLEWRRAWAASGAAARPLTLDRQMIRRLRSLGYVQ